ncbi:pro-cathepsin H [Protopterus annectens]|uniref:pro-cathepsin H n=1 Tax=Protopterus annectens TaxID=7888 RepID=UPI001CFB3D46|nr:pro-cathepsin H [Protopterus annectens]
MSVKNFSCHVTVQKVTVQPQLQFRKPHGTNRKMLSEVFLIAAVVQCTLCAPLISTQEEGLFKSWLSEFKKDYILEEYNYRLQTFAENKRKIDKHNAGNHTFKMGLNQFSDMTFDEFKKKYLWTEPQNCSATKGNFVGSDGPYPDSVDWRKKGNYVTPVKNQGGCGSCWTFSTTGCLESAVAIASGRLGTLSEQQLVDCASAFNNHGCRGGLPSQAFEYIRYNKGLMSEDSYPYTAQEGKCVYQQDKGVAFVKDVINITKYDEDGMVAAVAKFNPVSFAFQVTSDFMSYKDGIYSSTTCGSTPDDVNHAVLAVGYDIQNGTPYWIVKNSWGPSWGINGYFNIERGKNMCGVAACASYPIPQI